jgi:hypothetical protein
VLKKRKPCDKSENIPLEKASGFGFGCWLSCVPKSSRVIISAIIFGRGGHRELIHGAASKIEHEIGRENVDFSV